MTALYFLKDYWYLPLLVIAAVLVWILWPKGRPDMTKVNQELEVIRAGAEARKERARVGTEKATQAVKDKYQAKEAALNAEAKAKAAELESDPVALARYLERATR